MLVLLGTIAPNQFRGLGRDWRHGGRLETGME